MGFFNRLLGSMRPSTLDSDLKEEQQYHLELAQREFEQQGMTPAEARSAAIRRFGNRALLQEDTRRTDLLGWLDDAFTELRIAARALVRTPVYSLIVVAALALGVGACTAVYSLVHGILIRSLPYPDSERLTFAFTKMPEGRRNWANYEDLNDWRKSSKSFSHLAAWVSQTANLTGIAEPDRVRAGFISHDFFATLGVGPEQGRAFHSSEERNADRVVVISSGMWQERFGGRADLLGNKVMLNGEPYTVVGILPKSFEFAFDKIDVWMPFTTWPAYTPGRGSVNTAAIGRLAPGVPIETAQAELAALAKGLANQFPATNRDRATIELTPFQEAMVEDLRPALYILGGAVFLALLVACANIASLTISRVVSRGRELAIRAALGAGRARLFRHLWIEQLALALIGGGLGLVIAYALTRLAVSNQLVPLTMDPRIDWRVAIVCLLLSALSAFLTGPLPALTILRGASLAPAAGTSDRGASEQSSTNRTRRVLVSASVAVSLVLLAGTALFLKSLQRVTGVDLGFRSERLLTLEYRMPQAKYPKPEQQVEFHRQIVERTSAIPGVQASTVMMALPFSGNGSFSGYSLPGQTPPPNLPRAQVNRIDPSFLATMQIPLLRGRTIEPTDRLGSEQVALVSKSMAERNWPGQDPLRRQVILPDFAKQQPITIVGVVADSKHNSLEEQSRDKVYLSFAQFPHIFGALAVRTPSDPESFAPAVRKAIWSVDKDQPVWKVRSMDTMINNSLLYRRGLATVIGVFSLFALLLATLGLYGVISYATSRRTRELGIRAALGATGGNLVGMVVRQGLRSILIGLLIGIAGSVAVSRLLSSQLFEVSISDPTPYLAAVATLFAAAVAATLVPALRAASIDPVRALRQE